MRAWEKRERKTAGNSTEREARPYCDRGGERENQRKEGDGWMDGMVWHSGVIQVAYTLHVRCNPSKCSIPFPCGLRARACSIGIEAFFEVGKNGKVKKGQITAVRALRGFRKRPRDPLSFPPNVKYEHEYGWRMLPRLWFIQVQFSLGCQVY